MEGVAEDDLRAGRFNFFRRHPFHGAIGANRHKGWRFNDAALKHKTAAARATIGGI